MAPGSPPVTARIVRRDSWGTKEALRLLARGEVVVLPTNLVYGFFCDATNPDAVARVQHLKSRASFVPLPVLASADTAGRYADLPERVQRAIALAWPCGLSFVVPRLPTVPERVTGGATVMLFSPDSWTAELADRAPFPLAGTSANAAGEEPCVTAQDAFSRFGKDVNLVVDGGTSVFGRNTSIVDATRSPPAMVRESVVPFEAARRHFADLVRA